MPGGNYRRPIRPAIALVLLAATVSAIIAISGRSSPTPTNGEPVKPDSGSTGLVLATPDPALVAVGRRLRAGENLAQVLEVLGLPAEAARATEAALARTDFDFQRLMPGDSVTVHYLDSVPVGLRYEVDLATGYEVRFGPDSVSAVRTTVPVETAVIALVGAVRGSLWQSLIEAGADDRLTASYTSILRHCLPRISDMHPGDSFELVVERLTVGDSFYNFGNIHALRYKGATDIRAYHHSRPDGVTFYCDPDGRSLSRVLGYPPIPGARITSDFGPRLHPVVRRRIHHNGIDYEAAYGTPVRAVADGTVSRARPRRGYGRVVDIEHDRLGLNTRYAHLSRYAEGVRPGARVSRGDTIGYVGSTGLSSGAHLHFETIRGGRAINPLDALPSGRKQVAPEVRAEFERFMADCREAVDRALDMISAHEPGDRAR